MHQFHQIHHGLFLIFSPFVFSSIGTTPVEAKIPETFIKLYKERNYDNLYKSHDMDTYEEGQITDIYLKATKILSIEIKSSVSFYVTLYNGVPGNVYGGTFINILSSVSDVVVTSITPIFDLMKIKPRTDTISNILQMMKLNESGEEIADF